MDSLSTQQTGMSQYRRAPQQDQNAPGAAGASASQEGAVTSTRSARDSLETKRRNEREANRIHCRETRERKREKERLLREEVEILTLYKAIVEEGPDLFSLHRVDIDAPFSFLCENYYQRLQLAPEDVLGQPLASIVDPRDAYTLRTAIFQVLNQDNTGAGGAAPTGTLVNLRVACGGLSCPASMTIVIGSQGLIVVTRLYDV